jgi:hypothetical protein
LAPVAGTRATFGELQAVRRRLQAVGLLVDRIRQGFGRLGELLRRLLSADVALDGGAHLFEGLHHAGLDVVQMDDVEAELALDDIADVALLQGEHGVLEGLDHRATRHEAEIAALLRRPRVLRVLARHGGEGAGRLANLGQELGRTCARLVALGGRRAGRGGDQDVARAAFLGRSEAGLVLLVVAAQIGIADGDVLLDGVHVEHDVLDAGLLGRLELRGMRLVVGLEVGVLDGDLGAEVGRIEAHGLDLATIVERVERQLRLGRRRERRARDTQHDLLRRQLGSDGSLVLLRRAAGGQHEALAIELAVGRAERRQPGVLGEQPRQPLLRDRHVRLLGGGGQHAVAHHAFEGRIARRVGVEQRGIDIGHLLTDAIDLVAMLGVPLGPRDVLAIDACHLLALLPAVVAIDAEQHERRDDQQEQEPHDDLVVLAEKLKHA